jgi:redox-sensitive bicupin YhaK (pirin superfamily)
MVLKVGTVQWTTAGTGIIHTAGPTKEFVLIVGYF